MKATLALVLGLAAVLLFAPAARADVHAAKSPYGSHVVAALGHAFGLTPANGDGGDDHEGSDDNHEHEGSEGSNHGDGHDHGGDDSASDDGNDHDGDAGDQQSCRRSATASPSTRARSKPITRSPSWSSLS